MTNDFVDPSTGFQHGPWPCTRNGCNAESPAPYRCQECGHPLEGKTGTTGREERQ